MNFNLDDHGFCWVMKTALPSWKGYLDCSGGYGSDGGSPVSDGSVDIVFAPEGRDNCPLTERERALVSWLIDNEQAVSEAVKSAIFAAYPALQESYGYNESEAAKYMPRISSVSDLRQLIGLYAVNVHQVVKNDLPYLGFEFGCAWDEEHGLGVLMHGMRAVEVGEGDTAILLWMAEQDAAAS